MKTELFLPILIIAVSSLLVDTNARISAVQGRRMNPEGQAEEADLGAFADKVVRDEREVCVVGGGPGE